MYVNIVHTCVRNSFIPIERATISFAVALIVYILSTQRCSFYTIHNMVFLVFCYSESIKSCINWINLVLEAGTSIARVHDG